MSITSTESVLVSPYDGAMDAAQVVDVSEGGVLRREAIALLESLDDPNNIRVNRLLKKSEHDPVRREFRLAWNILQIAINPGPGNQNIKVNIEEQMHIIRTCLSQVSDSESAVAVQNHGRLNEIGRYVRASLSFFS